MKCELLKQFKLGLHMFLCSSTCNLFARAVNVFLAWRAENFGFQKPFTIIASHCKCLLNFNDALLNLHSIYFLTLMIFALSFAVFHHFSLLIKTFTTKADPPKLRRKPSLWRLLLEKSLTSDENLILIATFKRKQKGYKIVNRIDHSYQMQTSQQNPSANYNDLIKATSFSPKF